VAHDSGTHTLYIKGFGDPLFVSEVIEKMCGLVKKKTGIRQIDRIILDPSWFDDKIQIPGTGRSLNPYDATTGALCANFNTVYFKQNAEDGTWVSSEPQTPLLEIFHDDIRRTGLTRGRILIRKEWRPVYPGLLMARFFREQGVAVTGPVETGPGPFGGTHAPDNPAGTDTFTTADGSDFSDMGRLETVTWYSPWPLDQVVKKMLAFSSNFIANQVMLTLGARVYGPPATLEKGVAVLRKFAAQQVGWEKVMLAEGSGLSRKNRVTPAQMGKLLLAFMPHHTLLKTTGTQYYKTGTLTGINTRAGYFVGTDHRLYPFVIMR
jgi:serine-type D-Ala-D-Ala carboxypeptidase/endopeptidase (penicillin-binding protein 4)